MFRKGSTEPGMSVLFVLFCALCAFAGWEFGGMLTRRPTAPPVAVAPEPKQEAPPLPCLCPKKAPAPAAFRVTCPYCRNCVTVKFPFGSEIGATASK